MKSRYKCCKSARNVIIAYFSGNQSSLRSLVWNIYQIRMVGLIREDFERVLAGFKDPRIKEIQEAIEKTDVFGEFKGTRKH